MRFLLILIFLFAYGCKSSKQAVDRKIASLSSVNTIEVYKEDSVISLKSDSIVFLNELESVESTAYYEELDITDPDMEEYSPGVETNIEKSYNIINRIDTTKVTDNEFGTIAYNVPSKFKVNEYSTIKLRISKNKSIESVVIGDRNIPIIGTNSDDEIILETIKVDKSMKATLYTDVSLFEVNMVNENAEQSLYKDGYTEWVWRVRPLKPGNHYIKMLITISGRDIVVYEKNIPVESNWKFSFSEWFSKWWQAITATIITPIVIPFIIWFYRRRKTKKTLN